MSATRSGDEAVRACFPNRRAAGDRRGHPPQLTHEFDLGAVGVTPFAQLGHTIHATEAFTETGGAAALSSAASVVNDTFTALGLRGDYQFVAGGDGLAAGGGGLAWRHGFGGGAGTSNAFAGGSAFAVSGAPAATDALLLEADLTLDLANGIDLSLTYAGLIAPTAQSHAFSAGIGGRF